MIWKNGLHAPLIHTRFQALPWLQQGYFFVFWGTRSICIWLLLKEKHESFGAQLRLEMARCLNAKLLMCLLVAHDKQVETATKSYLSAFQTSQALANKQTKREKAKTDFFFSKSLVYGFMSKRLWGDRMYLIGHVCVEGHWETFGALSVRGRLYMF